MTKNVDAKERQLFAKTMKKQEDPATSVMFTNDDDSDLIRRAVHSGVSAYIVDGINARRVRPIIDAAIARFEQFDAMRTELENAKSTLESRKIVEKAKGLLMESKDMNEADAYRAMQRMAMDRNLKMVDLARSIIAAAELLE